MSLRKNLCGLYYTQSARSVGGGLLSSVSLSACLSVLIPPSLPFHGVFSFLFSLSPLVSNLTPAIFLCASSSDVSGLRGNSRSLRVQLRQPGCNSDRSFRNGSVRVCCKEPKALCTARVAIGGDCRPRRETIRDANHAEILCLYQPCHPTGGLLPCSIPFQSTFVLSCLVLSDWCCCCTLSE